MLENLVNIFKKKREKGRGGIHFTNIKVKKILIITFLLIGTIPLIIVGYNTYNESRKTIEQRVGFYSQQIAEQAVDKLNYKLDEIEKSSMMIVSDRGLNELLSETEYDNPYDEMVAQQDIQAELDSISQSSDDFAGIALYREDKDNIYSNISRSNVKTKLGESFSDSEVFNEVAESSGKPIWVAGYNKYYNNFYMMRKILNLRNSKLIGVLVYIVDIDVLNNIISDVELGEGAEVHLLSEDNVIMSSINEDMIGNDYSGKVNLEETSDFTTANGKLTSFGTTGNGWKMVSVIPLDSLMGAIYDVGEKTVVLVIICAVIAILLGLYISFGISNPLQRVVSLMGKVEDGDLTVSSTLEGKNEIGRLVKSFNEMTKNIRGLINDTRHTSDKVLEDVDIINEVSQQSYSSARQVSQSVETISIGAQDQADEAQSNAEVMELLAERIGSVNNNIKTVLESAREIENTSKNTGKIVSDLNEKSDVTTSMSTKIKKDINNLNDKAVKISNIVDLIDGISEQTSLLSLNASIEAARAGAVGKGFGVVAEEIKELAEQTSDATKTIAVIVEEILAESQNSVEEVEKANEIFEEQNEAVQKTEKAFQEIISLLSSITEEVNGVSDAIEEINEYKEKAVDDIMSISSIAEQAAGSTEEVTAASEEQVSLSDKITNMANDLDSTVNDLKKTLEKFKT